MEGDDRVGSVGCKILTQKGKTWFSQKFTNGGFIVPFFLQTLVDRRIEMISNYFCINLANSGCAVLYRRNVLDEVGFYDEDFWSNWEDWDLGYRINLAGFKSMYVPGPLVYHVGGGSERFSPERYVRIYRNMLFTYFKNYETRNLFIRFPILLFILIPLQHIGWILHRLLTHPPSFVRQRGLQYFFSLIKAYFEFLSMLRIFAQKRYFIQLLRKTPDKEIFLNTTLKGVL